VIGKTTTFVSFFNDEGGSPLYHGAGISASARYAVSAHFQASVGYTYMRDQSRGENDADQFSAACEYEISPTVTLYASVAMLRNHGDAEFTLRGVDVTGLTPAYPGAPVRGVEFGLIERF
jgi:predicted porin